MIELEKPAVVLGHEPLEPQCMSNLTEETSPFSTPGIEVTSPDHRSDVILYGFGNRLNLTKKWLPKIKIHRMGIDDQELLRSSGDIDQTHSRCFRSSQERLTIDTREDCHDFLMVF